MELTEVGWTQMEVKNGFKELDDVNLIHDHGKYDVKERDIGGGSSIDKLFNVIT